MKDEELDRIPGDYTIRNLRDKKAVSAYLKKDTGLPEQKKNIEAIRKKGESLHKYDPKSIHLEDYLFMQRQSQLRLTLIQRMNRFLKRRFSITLTQDSLIIWKTKSMRDLLYLHVPRMLFVLYTCYICYKIQDRIGSTHKNNTYVRSIREETVDQQLKEINNILLSTDNQFDPATLQQRATPLSIQQPNYAYKKENQEYQDQLIKLYQELDADYERKKAEWRKFKERQEPEEVEEEEEREGQKEDQLAGKGGDMQKVRNSDKN